MRIPIGVVEIILRMVEEKHLAEHKERFFSTLDMFDSMCYWYKNEVEFIREDLMEFYEDEDVELSKVVAENTPSFITVCKNSFTIIVIKKMFYHH